MFARGSHGDANHRGSDAEADASPVANANFRSDEAAGSRANVSAKYFSYSTTYCVSVVSADWPTDGCADASTVSSTDIVTDCPADRGADASTFRTADCAADYPANNLADIEADGGAPAATDTGTDRGAYSITFGTTNGAANDVSDGEAYCGADGGASTATDTGTDRAAVAATLSAANCAADSVSHGGAVAITLGAADDSFSNSETFAATLIAANCAADSVSDGEAFAITLGAADDSVADGKALFDADDGAHRTAVAAADYFAANHITATYSDSDHEYAYDVNSDVCSLRLAIITSGAKPYGAALQHADDRSAVATAVADPDRIADVPPVASTDLRSVGNSDREPNGRADSPPVDLARTDYVRSVAVADSLAGSDNRTHAPRTSRSARQHYLGSRHVRRHVDRRRLRRRGEHLPVV